MPIGGSRIGRFAYDEGQAYLVGALSRRSCAGRRRSARAALALASGPQATLAVVAAAGGLVAMLVHRRGSAPHGTPLTPA